MNIERVILAEPRGFCAGVIRAIEAVELALAQYGPPIYVRRQIVHNLFVVRDLERKGAVFVEEVSAVPAGGRVIFSAHGIAPIVREMAQGRDLDVIDATCPLVTKVHVEAVRYVRDGYKVLLVGHAGHDEIIGTMGEAPDDIILVQDMDDVTTVSVPDEERVALVTQTTLSVDETKDIVDALKARFPKIRMPARSDICFATQNRQDAVKLLAEETDVVLVLGAENSSNSQRLREVANTGQCRAYLIDSLQDLDESWLEGAQSVGITSGASTPDSLVEEVIAHFMASGVEDVRTLKALEENVTFLLPRELAGIKAG
ncbi:MAG: 4-hydroxy-3-methylbut-2-enyl diphosphate reductase [Dehalococcoidia bacterium]|nr:4-hydroxy-3-methylbut-2-enyl diphosphate reductase [Dehalococcoidia bacterium]